MKRFLYIVFFFFLLSAVKSQFYSGSHLTFGKNRVQYIEFLWTSYRFQKFDVFFYVGGKNVALYTSKVAEKHLKELEKIFDYDMEDRIQFIVYNKLSDLKQSNIGLVGDEQYNVGGTTYISGNKVLLYYDGDHKNLDEQIRAGIAQILINQMVFGDNIGSMVKNSTLLSLPDWYLQGLVSYVSHKWDSELDNIVEDGILSGKYEKFNNLTGEDAVYAGHSIWNFIAEKYGKNRISNIVYMTRISRNIESGFLFILGVPYKELIQEWINYYDLRYYEQDKKRDLPKGNTVVKKVNKNRVYSQFRISPDGKNAAWVTNELGQYKVWVFDFETKKTKRIIKAGYKLEEKTDYTYPLLQWHPSSEYLTIMRERKGKNTLTYYYPKNKKRQKLQLFYLEKILDYSFSNDGKMIVLSGVLNGQTDIFIYNFLSKTQEQLTKDMYDDLHPKFINNNSRIVFSSNRSHDTLSTLEEDIPRQDFYDLFIYNYKNRSPLLINASNTSQSNELYAQEYDDNYVCYVSDNNGIYNRYIAKIDSTISYVDTIAHYRPLITNFPITNYKRNILEQTLDKKSGRLSEIVYEDGRYNMFYSTVESKENLQSVDLTNTITKSNSYIVKATKDSIYITPERIERKIKKRLSNVSVKEAETELESGVSGDTTKVDINNYSFGSEPKKIKLVTTSDSLAKTTVPEKKDSIARFVIPRQRNYNMAFTINQLVSQIDFSYLNSSYQPFTGGGVPIYINPGFNAFIKVGIADMFEDYRLTGGLRLSSSLSNNEYLLSYENYHGRFDKEIIFHKQSLDDMSDYSLIKHQIHELKYILKYPFDNCISLRGTATAKHDRTVYKSTDYYNLIEPNQYDYWGIAKLEFVYDNVRNKGLNLYYGTRFKLFAEYYKQFNKDKNLTVIGLDFRNYQKIHKTFIWANRFATSTSFGKEKLIYYLGGVDNWLFPKFDNSVDISANQNYGYQTIATNMRGFHQNIRNGNSFAVINSELRFPIVKYFSTKPVKSDFFNNLQIVGFGDLGTAWEGSNPYSKENSLFTEVIQKGPIKVTLETMREPIVGGYGFGVRSRLLGYFIRADWAWGVEDGKVQPRIFYVSLSLDF